MKKRILPHQHSIISLLNKIKSFIFILVLIFYKDAYSLSKRRMASVIAIQDRPYQLDKEFGLNLGVMPLDNFHIYSVVETSLALYFTEYLGWEIFHAGYAKESPTGLENYLKSNYNAVPESFDLLQYYGTSNLIYTPLYMKSLYKGESIIWGDISFLLGYGMSVFKTAKNVNTIEMGTMIRFFRDRKWSYKFELRNYYFLANDLKPSLSINMGLSYHFGSGEEIGANNK